MYKSITKIKFSYRFIYRFATRLSQCSELCRDAIDPGHSRWSWPWLDQRIERGRAQIWLLLW